MKKSLSIKTPPLTIFTHHAYSLMALSSIKDSDKWIYSNYIQLYMNKDLNKNPWGDFYFPMPYEVKCYELSPYLKIQKAELKLFAEKGKSLAHVIESIDRGYFVHTLLDYYFVSQSPFYLKSNRIHDCLIYGYDKEKKELYCADYMFSDVRKLSYGTVLFDEYENAIESASKGEDQILNGYILGMRPYKTDKYDFRINNIVYGLRQYLECSVPEYWKGYNYGNQSEIVWGLDCYDAYLNYLASVSDRVDLRFAYLFMEHKKMMIERLRLLSEEMNVSHLDESIVSYTKMEEALYKALNYLLKYTICKNSMFIQQACNIIKSVKGDEEKSIRLLISELEEQE